MGGGRTEEEEEEEEEEGRDPVKAKVKARFCPLFLFIP
jgi:hypothetical protein